MAVDIKRQIGEIFEYNGIKLRVEKTQKIGRCDGCYFESCLHSCAESIPVRGLCVDVTKNMDVIFKKVENMEERTIKLTLEKAKEFYKEGGKLKDLALSAYTESELKPLPDSWDEFRTMYDFKPEDTILLSEQQYKAHAVLLKLHILRDCYRQGWEPNWNDYDYMKYAIIREENHLKVISVFSVSSFLSFQTRKIAEQFMKNFRDLIEEAGDLI